MVAVMAAVGGVLASLIQSMRRENHNDHATVAGTLDRIESKIDGHIRDHATGEFE